MSHLHTALVTGASHGIGLEVARRLAHQGSRVIVHAPTPAQARAAVARLLRDDADPGLLHAASADFRRLSDVTSLATQLGRQHDRLDLLIDNAGAVEPASRTRDGLDVNFQINFVAPYALTRLLVPALNTAGARVVTVASPRHRDSHLDLDDLGGDHGRPGDAYARAQGALLLFTRALAGTAEQRITAVPDPPYSPRAAEVKSVAAVRPLPAALTGRSSTEDVGLLLYETDRDWHATVRYAPTVVLVFGNLGQYLGRITAAAFC